MPIAKEAGTSGDGDSAPRRPLDRHLTITMLIKFASPPSNRLRVRYEIILCDGDGGDGWRGEGSGEMNEYGTNEKKAPPCHYYYWTTRGSIRVGRSIHVKRLYYAMRSSPIIKT